MSVKPLFFALNGISRVKYEKKLSIMPISCRVFTTLGLIWPKFCPKTTPTLIYFVWFLVKYVRGFN